MPLHSPKPRAPKTLGAIEQSVLETLWKLGPSTADACRKALARTHPMEDSTIRTVLRRLEEKGYLNHQVDGRTYIYSPAEGQLSVAARSVRQLVDRFCGGSIEQLLVGMVDHDVLDADELARLARQIAARKEQEE